ncbi:MAG TPA: hypothetical protein EYQ43_04320 [Methyloprofundus sp.]|nr:hypothetical protein [Methyloprofundus sp.]
MPLFNIKEYERTVTAKGLSEHEYPADIVICPFILPSLVMILLSFIILLKPATSRLRISWKKTKSAAMKYHFRRLILPVNPHSNTGMLRRKFAIQYSKPLPFTQKISS